MKILSKFLLIALAFPMLGLTFGTGRPPRQEIFDKDKDTRITTEETTDEDKIRMFLAGSEKFFLDTGGFLSLGHGNTPDVPLDVRGDPTNPDMGISFTDTTAASTSTASTGGYTWYGSDRASGGVGLMGIMGHISAVNNTLTFGNILNGDLDFLTNNGSRMHIQADGKVVVGLGNGFALFNVRGDPDGNKFSAAFIDTTELSSSSAVLSGISFWGSNIGAGDTGLLWRMGQFSATDNNLTIEIDGLQDIIINQGGAQEARFYGSGGLKIGSVVAQTTNVAFEVDGAIGAMKLPLATTATRDGWTAVEGFFLGNFTTKEVNYYNGTSFVALAELPITRADHATGTAGELPTWDPAGDPDKVAVGTAGQVLKSNGIGAAPTFQDESGATKEFWALPQSSTVFTNSAGIRSVNLNSNSEAFFSGFMPADFVTATAIEVIVLAADTDTYQWDSLISFAAPGEVSTINDASELDETQAVTDTEIEALDVSAVWTGIAAGDLYSYNFQSDFSNIRVIGIRFKY